MKLELHLVNCFWLILPRLAWNIILGARVTDLLLVSYAHSPNWL